MNCGPCYLEQVSDCHRGHACMTGLLPRAVYGVCQRLLALRSKRRRNEIPATLLVLHRDLQDIGLDDEQIVLIIKKLLRAVPVDEEWYLRTYPDVAVGIENGNTKSAKHHFVTDGYFEGRLPFEHEIDEEW